MVKSTPICVFKKECICILYIQTLIYIYVIYICICNIFQCEKAIKKTCWKKSQKTFHQCVETETKNKIFSLILENMASERKKQALAEPTILMGSCKYSYNFPSFSEWQKMKERKACRQKQRQSSYFHNYAITHGGILWTFDFIKLCRTEGCGRMPQSPLLTVTPTACRLSGLAPSISWDSDSPACSQEGSQGLEDVVFPGQHPASTASIEWKH